MISTEIHVFDAIVTCFLNKCSGSSAISTKGLKTRRKTEDTIGTVLFGIFILKYLRYLVFLVNKSKYAWKQFNELTFNLNTVSPNPAHACAGV